jgi:hypothetical protein
VVVVVLVGWLVFAVVIQFQPLDALFIDPIVWLAVLHRILLVIVFHNTGLECTGVLLTFFRCQNFIVGFVGRHPPRVGCSLSQVAIVVYEELEHRLGVST